MKKKNQINFKSKLSDERRWGQKSTKQSTEIKNITNIYNAYNCAIKFFEDFSRIMHNDRYDTTHARQLKILKPKQLLQRFK